MTSAKAKGRMRRRENGKRGEAHVVCAEMCRWPHKGLAKRHIEIVLVCAFGGCHGLDEWFSRFLALSSVVVTAIGREYTFLYMQCSVQKGGKLVGVEIHTAFL